MRIGTSGNWLVLLLLAILSAALALAALWWNSIPSYRPEDRGDMARLLQLIRAAPESDLSLRDRFVLEKDLLQAEAAAYTSASTARAAAFLQAFGALVQGGTFVAAVIAGYVGWRNLRATHDKLDVDRRGQITNRFTEAIAQLGENTDGKANLAVRLGGIYALERIAHDAPEDYYWTVMDVLTAYVRLNAPWLPIANRAVGDQVESPKPRTDIQAALTVIGRGNAPREDEAWDQPPWLHPHALDLAGTDLRGLYLWGARLKRAILRDAHLEKAYLREVNLDGADLGNAHLQGAFLKDTQITRANLSGANFEGSAGLTKADIRSAHEEGHGALLPAYLQESHRNTTRSEYHGIEDAFDR